MFNPFHGETRARVMEKLLEVAKKHPITVCTTGPMRVAQPWLTAEADTGVYGAYTVSVFKSDPALCEGR